MSSKKRAAKVAGSIRYLIETIAPSDDDKWERWASALEAEDIYLESHLIELHDSDFDALSITGYLKHLLRKFRRGQCAIGEEIDAPADSESKNIWPRFGLIRNAHRLLDFSLPFEHSMNFKRGIMNAKTGAELKEYMANVW